MNTVKKTKIPKLPTGSKPLGPVKTGNVIEFPMDRVKRLPENVTVEWDTQVIYVDFVNKKRVA